MYDKRHFIASVNAPIIDDQLFINLAVSDLERDGFTRNTFLNNDVDFLDEQNIRGKLRWLPSDRWDITLALDHAKIRNGFYDDAISSQVKLEDNKPHATAYDFPGYENRDANGGSLRLRYQADSFDFLSVTGYRDTDYTFIGEFDISPAPGINDVFNLTQQQFTQELRFSSKSEANFSWLIGAYLFDDDRDGHDEIAAFSPYSFPLPSADIVTESEVQNRGHSIFANIDYSFTEHWSLQAGLRYEDQSQKFNTEDVTTSSGFPVAATPRQTFKQDFSETVSRIGITYKFSDNFLWYSSRAEGFRGGGFNTRSFGTADVTYAPETSTNYETGLKYISSDNKRLFNIALFQIDIDDQQISQSIGAGIEVTRNAGESRHRGIEIDASYITDSGWQLSTSAAYLDTEFKSFINPLAGTDFSGNTVPFSPDITAMIAIQKYFNLTSDLDLFTRAEVKHIGDIYYNEANTLKGEDYSLLNVRLGVESEGWGAYLWANNLTDEEYIGSANVNPVTFTNDFSYGAPRTVGLTLQARF